jgi:hypothetical protein
MSKSVPCSTSNKDWEAESDARSLMEHCKITSDPERMAKAKKALVALEAEAEKTLAATKAAKGLKRAFLDRKDEGEY